MIFVKHSAFALAAAALILGCVAPGQKQEVQGEVAAMGSMTVTSKAFKDGENIPPKYTCDGDDISPPLKIDGIPPGTKSLALIVDDPDAPRGDWIHWVVWNIDPKTGEIAENTKPGTQGTNDFRRQDWGGPCPPSGIHRYVFKAYALDTTLNLNANSGKKELLDAMTGHTLDKAQLTGRYKRQ